MIGPQYIINFIDEEILCDFEDTPGNLEEPEHCDEGTFLSGPSKACLHR